MFKETIKPAMKKKINQLEENQAFLNEIITSLQETFIGHVEWDRTGNLKTVVKFSIPGSSVNIIFTLTDNEIEFFTSLDKYSITSLGLERVCKGREDGKKVAYHVAFYSLVGKKLPKWANLDLFNSERYYLKFTVNKTDKNIKKKIEMISAVLQGRCFKIRFDAMRVA